MRFFIILLFSFQLFSQDYPDTRGREFFFSFMPNVHTLENQNRQELVRGDSLHLFVIAEEETSATLSIWNINEDLETIEFTIPQNDFFQIKKSYNDYEPATGSNQNGKVRGGANHSNRPVKISWHLKSENKVGAMILNAGQLSTDAAMLFPLESLGEEYFATSYISDDFSGATPQTNSQFMIVATEDNTEVQIEYGNNHNRADRIVNLNKHEIFLSGEDNVVNDDISGTRISSNNRIAVFGGHERAKVPVDGTNNSRDHLFEQMPPINTWSTDYYIVNFVQEFEGQQDIYRVITANDDAQIFANGNLLTTLNPGDVYEANIDEPLHISSDSPLLVSQIKMSSSAGGGLNTSTSDPFFVLVPPQSNFHTQFRFVSMYARGFNNNPTQNGLREEVDKFSNHYITIIAGPTFSGSVSLDGNQIPVSTTQIADTDYSFANLSVAPGSHFLDSDTPIGLYVYGYGQVDSYGYLGGMSFQEFDFYNPELTFNSDCISASGTFTDTLTTNGFIDFIELEDDTNLNLELNGDSFTISLIDPNEDGSGFVVATDNDGLKTRTELIELQGFGLEVISGEFSELRIPTFEERCATFTIQNNSSSERIIDNIELDGPGDLKLSDNNFPLSIGADQSLNVEVCFNESSEGEVISSLVIENECYREKLLEINQTYRNDNESPNLAIEVSECPGEFQIFATETGEFDRGIEEAYPVLEENINTINIEVFDKEAIYSGEVIDRRQDARIEFEVIDKNGNTSRFGRTFRGFTLEFLGDLSLYENLEGVLRETNCFNVNITNYGGFRKEINKLYFLENSNFSIPQSELPFNLEPDETKVVSVCLFEKGTIGTIRDTLVIASDCDELKLPFNANVFATNYNSDSRCRLELEFVDRNNTDDFVGNLSPNPSTDNVSLIYGTNSDKSIDLYVLSANGEKVTSQTWQVMSGTNRININIQNLENGFYQLILIEDGRQHKRSFIKQK